MPRLGLVVAAIVASAASSLLARSARAQNTDVERREIDGVPIAGGDSDIGIGGGAVGAITQFDRSDQHRWLWRLEGAVFLTVRGSPNFNVPYQDHWLQLTLPYLLGGKLRFQTRVAFTEETDVRYFGVGNGLPTPPDSGSPFYVYGRTHPEFEAYARVSAWARTSTPRRAVPSRSTCSTSPRTASSRTTCEAAAPRCARSSITPRPTAWLSFRKP